MSSAYRRQVKFHTSSIGQAKKKEQKLGAKTKGKENNTHMIKRDETHRVKKLNQTPRIT